MPYIVARGRKGGSNVAAAICNALLYTAAGSDAIGRYGLYLAAVGIPAAKAASVKKKSERHTPGAFANRSKTGCFGIS